MYHVNGKAVSLGQKEFISQGGEGMVYGKGDTAYKIYHKLAIPIRKIKALSVLDDHNIIRPLAVIEDGNGKVVGYTMRLVKGAIPLPRLFLKGHDNEAIIVKMAKRLDYIHSKNVLVVDYNEMNLAALDGDTVMYDVDSWCVPGYPATALMESVRDRHDSGFNNGTDWFSFGVVAFQLAIGIHPYKGKYAAILYDDAGKTLDQRMKGNISVMHKGVRLPPVCRPLDSVALPWRKWFWDVFEAGQRSAPPIAGAVTVTLAPAVVVVRLVEVDYTPPAEREYRLVGSAVVEIVVMEGIQTLKTMCQVLPLATSLFRGVAVQSLLGSFFAFLLDGTGCRQVRIPELDSCRVIDGGWENGTLVLIAEQNGNYSRWVFAVGGDNAYSFRMAKDIAYLGVNFTVLDNGTTVLLTEDSIELSRNGKVTVIQRAMAGKLHHDSIGAIVEDGGRYYRLV